MAKQEQHAASQHYGTDWRLWLTHHDDGHVTLDPDLIQVILLQEIRDELQRLNRLLHCGNFTGLPREIRSIKREVATIRKHLKLEAPK